jgi:hypothetical protein
MKHLARTCALASSLFVWSLSTNAVAQPARGSHVHWVLLSKSKAFNEPVHSGTTLYRLITSGAQQLAVNTKVFEGLRLRPVAEGPENIAFHRRGTGDTVQLNEPVAIYLYARRAYLVFKQGRDFGLGLADYEPSREPPQERPAGIYQWRFSSAPESTTRDQRTRGLLTREELALFNTSKNDYLVYDRNARKLRWRTP